MQLSRIDSAEMLHLQGLLLCQFSRLLADCQHAGTLSCITGPTFYSDLHPFFLPARTSRFCQRSRRVPTLDSRLSSMHSGS